MATAAEQAQRDEEICAAHAAGETTAALVAKFRLSRSRINQIVAAGRPPVQGSVSGIQLAEERLADHRDLLAEIRSFAAGIAETQPAAKVGAYRLVFEALGHLTSLEQKLGYLPRDLAELRHGREFVETVANVLATSNDSADIRKELRKALEGPRWQA